MLGLGFAVIAVKMVRQKRKRRKGSMPVRPVERLVRRLGKGQKAMVDSYLDRHDRSNRKKQDGWLRDCADNVYKASSKGLRKLI